MCAPPHTSGAMGFDTARPKEKLPNNNTGPLKWKNGACAKRTRVFFKCSPSPSPPSVSFRFHKRLALTTKRAYGHIFSGCGAGEGEMGDDCVGYAIRRRRDRFSNNKHGDNVRSLRRMHCCGFANAIQVETH